jgi:HD-GYP domain-containing protein (c-di-GMP phosphodiesterase class II)
MAVVIENARLVKEIESGYLGALTSLILACENARPETRGHSRRVAGLAGAVARALGLEDSRVATLLQAAALHELGRLSESSVNATKAGGRTRSRGPSRR